MAQVVVKVSDKVRRARELMDELGGLVENLTEGVEALAPPLDPMFVVLSRAQLQGHMVSLGMTEECGEVEATAEAITAISTLEREAKMLLAGLAEEAQRDRGN